MGNVLSDAKRQQVLALWQLGWPLRRIEEATGVRPETASAYLKAAGVAVRPPRRWGHAPAKPAKEPLTDLGAGAEPAKEVLTDSGTGGPANDAPGCPRSDATEVGGTSGTPEFRTSSEARPSPGLASAAGAEPPGERGLSALYRGATANTQGLSTDVLGSLRPCLVAVDVELEGERPLPEFAEELWGDVTERLGVLYGVDGRRVERVDPTGSAHPSDLHVALSVNRDLQDRRVVADHCRVLSHELPEGGRRMPLGVGRVLDLSVYSLTSLNVLGGRGTDGHAPRGVAQAPKATATTASGAL